MPWWKRVKAAAGRLLAGIDRLEEQARDSSPEADARRLAREGQDGPRDLSASDEGELDVAPAPVQVVELEELDLDPLGEPQEILLDEITDPSLEPSSLDSLHGEQHEDMTELGLPAAARRVASLRDLQRSDEVPLGHLELDEDELEPTVLDGARADMLRQMARASDMGLVEAETRHEADDALLEELVDLADPTSPLAPDEAEPPAEDTWQWDAPPPEVVEEDEGDEVTEDEVLAESPETQEDAEPSEAEPVEIDTEESVQITDFSLDALVWEEEDEEVGDPDTDVESAPEAVTPSVGGYRPRFRNSLLIADAVVSQALRVQHYPELAHLEDDLLARLARLDAQLLVIGDELGRWALGLMDHDDALVEGAVLYTGLRTAPGIWGLRAEASSDAALRRRIGWAVLEHLPELQEVLGDHEVLEAGPSRLVAALNAREQLLRHAPELADIPLPVEPRGLHALPGFSWSD